MGIVEKISYWIDLIVRNLITIFLSVMTVILTVQIIARSVFEGGAVWTDELARFLMIAMIFLGAALAVRDKSHITVSIFEEWKPSLRKWFAPFQWIAMLLYAGILVKFGLDTLEVVGPQTSSNMVISMGIVYAVLPISAAIMIIHLIARIGKDRHAEKGGNE
ncbi:TRAP-type C4-dicarboxylate transport system permease small subunit [Virgibacillus natechei]|uniref:TRAP-type C4-dicarboxylate transport system permease small subunit n=1 Tax=Virgibacillus natechei TaxID=1216297 RepID=A0ABS4IL87_9BACI|nr:TRAP transporter small permease [Virgibacillus natechei]MBP1971713.1 TRAP-type C4-dicarboxylate transport system permease small subunit [Virgibacillus natechei]UZD12150.1 TRAP transporter small permease [Virgibacillus natechei]